MMMKPVLCYVRGQWAYFTTQVLAKQWGDDWNDAPYEHNAGLPYEYDEHDRKKGREPWRIVKLAFGAPLDEPCERQVNSSFSVEQINAGQVPWLAGAKCNIMAGTPLDKFIAAIVEAGGKVYVDADTWRGEFSRRLQERG